MGTRATLAERDARLARLRAAMAAGRLDALLVAGKGHWWTGRGYLRYLTDFHLWGHDGLLLVPLAGEPVLTLSSHAVAHRVAARGWVTDTRGDVYVVPRMVDAVKAKGLARARIGIAGLRWILPAGAHAELRSSLPDVTFADADDLIDHVRAQKSALELQQIRELWAVAKAAMERFATIVAPGASQRELAAEATKPVWAEGARDLLVFIGEGPGESDPPQEVPLRCDDVVRFHLEICGESGHWCEITINCAYRDPTPQELRLMESELAAFDAIRQTAKPGARLSDLAGTFDRVMREHGWDFGAPTVHFDFHGQGLDTIERPWYAAATPWGQSQDWELKAGMVFSYHPRRDVRPRVPWSTGINEDIVITEHGADRPSVDWDHRWRFMR
ncbi:MAG: M24 family metallopeptidase [Armatimonadota bacterium]|nr:M24 family metallopeptidase [Armatimonadota bacterium]